MRAGGGMNHSAHAGPAATDLRTRGGSSRAVEHGGGKHQAANWTAVEQDTAPRQGAEILLGYLSSKVTEPKSPKSATIAP
jgi:hypothetical protein